jgi:hypothetical protein
MLKLNPVIPDVILMVPVPTVHVGCVTLLVSEAGVAGGAFTTKVSPDDIQPAAFLALTI